MDDREERSRSSDEPNRLAPTYRCISEECAVIHKERPLSSPPRSQQGAANIPYPPATHATDKRRHAHTDAGQAPSTEAR